MITSCTERPSYRNESPVCTKWAFLRIVSSLTEKYEYVFVMDCKAKGDFMVREHYMSPEELNNQFAYARVFLYDSGQVSQAQMFTVGSAGLGIL